MFGTPYSSEYMSTGFCLFVEHILRPCFEINRNANIEKLRNTAKAIRETFVLILVSGCRTDPNFGNIVDKKINKRFYSFFCFSADPILSMTISKVRKIKLYISRLNRKRWKHWKHSQSK